MREVHITIGYLGHLIRSFCGDGRQWDMRITYTDEREPLGTLGGLSLLREQLENNTFLVLNGDVLTDLNISGFLATHREHGGPLTIATSQRSVRSDFGVIEQSCGRVICFREKPNLHHLVSMGIYCMDPIILDHIPAGVPFGFDDLMFNMLGTGVPAHTFLHSGFWLDIGRVEDFQKAQELGWDEEAPAFDTAPMSFEAA